MTLPSPGDLEGKGMAQRETRRNLVALGLVTLLAAACNGATPTAPPKVPTPDSPIISSVRIAGLPPTVQSGSTAQLTGQVVLQTGAVKDCQSATWSVDDTKVVNVSASGLLTGGVSGYAHVALSCEGLTTIGETKVEAGNPYQLVVYANDSELWRWVLLKVSLEFLEGPRAGERITSSDILENGLEDMRWPVRVRLKADGYEPKDLVLSEATGTRRNDSSPLFDFHVPMTFVPDALTDTHVRRLSETEMGASHPFKMRVPGPVQVRVWWSVDYNDRVTVELWCGGKKLEGITQLGASRGDGFTRDVPAPADCEVRLRQHKSDAGTHYRVAIRYAR